MNRIQFWIFSVTCGVVGLLYLAEIPLTLGMRTASRELFGMNLLIEQGQKYHDLWERIAYRAYQLGPQDPGLAEVLRHQQINITPRARPESAAPLPTPIASPTPSSTLRSNP
jgi:hypothetical protein